MATLFVDGDDLVVHMSTLEKVGAFHDDVRVPRKAITGVHVSERPFAELRGIRAPGTAIPRVIALGTRRGSFGKDFAAVYRHRPAVIVDLAGAPFSRLLISTPDGTDPDQVAAAVGGG